MIKKIGGLAGAAVALGREGEAAGGRIAGGTATSGVF